MDVENGVNFVICIRLERAKYDGIETKSHLKFVTKLLQPNPEKTLDSIIKIIVDKKIMSIGTTMIPLPFTCSREVL